MSAAVKLLLGFLCALALALPAAAAPAAGRTVKASAGDRLSLGLNKAAIIELPEDAADVLVSNPAIVDAIVRTPRRIYVLGLTVGQTNAFFFAADGRQILNLEIRIERDTNALADMLARHLPGTNIKVESVNDNVVLTGVVPSAQMATQAGDIAARYVGKPEQVLNMLSIAGREQVMIKVRVAEMQRIIAKQLGIDLKAAATAGGVPFAFNSTNAFGLLGRSLSSSGGTVGNYGPDGGSNNIEGAITALERAGVLRLLSEPNLTAISGETANFLAGGQFPVPTGTDDKGNVRIEFKQFGVGLGFTPVVLSEGRISLKVSSEVSELTNEGALNLPANTVTDSNGQRTTVPGLTIPGLRVRRAETTIEMPSGGSMMVAGLLRDDFKQSIDGLPGMKDLPVLGALFRSRDYQSNQTELVIIVTAVLVDPVSGKELAMPTTGFVPPTEGETILAGQNNAVYRTERVPEAPPAQDGSASSAYVIE